MQPRNQNNPQILEEPELKLDVPYLSQYLDIEDRIDAITSCGMTCVKMLLDYYKVPNDELGNLVKKGRAEGGYGQSGWIHDYFVKLFIEYGLSSHRMEKMNHEKGVIEIVKSIDIKSPVILSVERKLFSYPSFHMVLITGYKMDKSGNILGLYYSDPASTNRDTGKSRFAKIKELDEYWRHMAIFVKPKY